MNLISPRGASRRMMGRVYYMFSSKSRKRTEKGLQVKNDLESRLVAGEVGSGIGRELSAIITMINIISNNPSARYRGCMKTAKTYGLSLMVAGIIFSPAYSSACNVCHSKNPNMVRMHEALEYKNCFSCHQPGQIKTGAERKIQMTSERQCSGCHKK